MTTTTGKYVQAYLQIIYLHINCDECSPLESLQTGIIWSTFVLLVYVRPPFWFPACVRKLRRGRAHMQNKICSYRPVSRNRQLNSTVISRAGFWTWNISVWMARFLNPTSPRLISAASIIPRTGHGYGLSAAWHNTSGPPVRKFQSFVFSVVFFRLPLLSKRRCILMSRTGLQSTERCHFGMLAATGEVLLVEKLWCWPSDHGRSTVHTTEIIACNSKEEYPYSVG